jgi:hypothetical protein
VRWPVFPVGRLAKWVRERPDWVVTLAWRVARRRFLRIARQFSPQIILGHHGHMAGFVASNVARELNVPFFVAEHSFEEIDSCAANPHRKRHYARMLEGISGWIAVSKRFTTPCGESSRRPRS